MYYSSRRPGCCDFLHNNNNNNIYMQIGSRFSSSGLRRENKFINKSVMEIGHDLHELQLQRRDFHPVQKRRLLVGAPRRLCASSLRIQLHIWCSCFIYLLKKIKNPARHGMKQGLVCDVMTSRLNELRSMIQDAMACTHSRRVLASPERRRCNRTEYTV